MADVSNGGCASWRKGPKGRCRGFSVPPHSPARSVAFTRAPVASVNSFSRANTPSFFRQAVDAIKVERFDFPLPVDSHSVPNEIAQFFRANFNQDRDLPFSKVCGQFFCQIDLAVVFRVVGRSAAGVTTVVVDCVKRGVSALLGKDPKPGD